MGTRWSRDGAMMGPQTLASVVGPALTLFPPLSLSLTLPLAPWSDHMTLWCLPSINLTLNLKPNLRPTSTLTPDPDLTLDRNLYPNPDLSTESVHLSPNPVPIGPGPQ